MGSIEKLKGAIGISVASSLSAGGAMLLSSPAVAGVASAVAALAGAAAFFFSHRASQGIEQAESVCRRVDDGDFEARLILTEESGSIGRLHSSVNSMVDRCDAFVREASASMKYTSENRYSAAVEEQGAATREIARNVEEASIGTSEVTSNISGVTASVAETSEISGAVLTASSDLSKQAERMREEVDLFLSEVKKVV